MKITIHIPVTPAIKKYLEVKLGKDYHLSLDDWFGAMVINMFENKSTKYYSLENTNENRKTEKFSITLSMSMGDKNGFIILPKHEYLINKIVDSLFREDLYTNAIINKKEYSIDYSTTINNILDAYDITEEDLSIEALKRDLNRKKDDIEKKLFI